jgi:hypothetical protein
MENVFGLKNVRNDSQKYSLLSESMERLERFFLMRQKHFLEE